MSSKTIKYIGKKKAGVRLRLPYIQCDLVPENNFTATVETEAALELIKKNPRAFEFVEGEYGVLSDVKPSEVEVSEKAAGFDFENCTKRQIVKSFELGVDYLRFTKDQLIEMARNK